jgi:hypothetical protein
MRFFSDILVFFGAIILTFGTDLVVETGGQAMASVGGLLGVIASMIGVALLTAGILNHYRLSRCRENTDVGVSAQGNVSGTKSTAEYLR